MPGTAGAPTLPGVVARFAFLDHPGPIAFAHRGGGGEAAENTVAAFDRALGLGYRYLETDVHATADGVVAVIHDPVLDRVADRPGQVATMAWGEVATARLAGGERVPRLDELLDRWPDTRWNIDAKSDAVVEPLAQVVRRAGALERVCVTSFSDRRLGQIRSLLGPRLCTAMGPRSITALRAASWTPRGLVPGRVFSAFGAAQVPTRWGRLPVADRALVERAHGAGLAVHVWTVDDPTIMERLLDLGVDGIMTDHPSRLRAVLERRGQWQPSSGDAR